MTGNLSEFTLAQILQFFAIAERSGTVVIRASGKESRLLVDGDRVAGWGFDDVDVRSLLMDCDLLPSAIASELSRIVRREDTPGLSFVVRNLVEPGRWEAFSHRVLEQDIYPLMNAEDGEFEVAVGRCPPAPLRLSLQVNSLILDSSRWESEMEAAAVEGLSLRSRWARTNGLAPQSPLSGPEWLVWTATREPVALGDVAKRLCLPDLVAVNAIRRLSRQQLIRSADPAEENFAENGPY